MDRRYIPTSLTIALLCVLIFPASAAAEGRWRCLPIRSQEQYNLGMPGGAGEQHMHSIARSKSDPQVIYLSHDCAQIWRSDNGGKLWHKPSCAGMLVKAGQSIEVDPVHANIVLAMIDSSSNYLSRPYEGLYRSTDYGESWDLVLQTNSETQRMYQHCISYDPASATAAGAQRWYVGIPENGLFLSEDGGVNWTQIANLSSHTTIYSVQAHLTDGGSAFVGANSGLYRATNTTFTPWGDLPSGAVSCIAMHPTDPDTMYATVLGAGLYRSTNGGINFSLVRSTSATGVFLNEGYPDTIWLVSTSTDLVVSHNAGSTWSTPTVHPPLGLQREGRDEIDGSTTGISPDPRDANKAMAFSNAWLSRTEDGANFYDTMGLFTGYNWGWWFDPVAYDVADPNRMFLFCADIGMVRTTNGGLWWERRKAPWSWYSSGQVSWRGMYAADLYPVTGSDTFIASIGMYWDCKLLRSDDAGENYSLIEHNPENYLFIAFNPDNPDIVYAGDRRSTDGGHTFQAIPYLDAYNASILGMCRAHPDTIYAMANPREMIFRSDDAGVTWRLYASPGWRFNGLDSKPTFAVDPVNPDLIYTLDADFDLASFDGTTWTTLGVKPLTGPAPYRQFVHGVAIDPRYPNIIYAQMHAAGYPQTFRSTDSGATWQDITYNLPRTGTGSISVHPLTGDLMHSCCAGTRVYPPPYASPNSIFNNCPGAAPIARAGDDIVAIDSDGLGFAVVSLDGSASSAPDTGIVDYMWTSGGSYLGQGAGIVTALAVGEHTVKLTITDGDGVQDEDTVQVSAIAAIPGDADLDDDVDLDDFVLLKSNWGRSDATWGQGDFDGDGDVDLDDFVILKINWGT